MILNPFATDAFNMVSLTNSINILPNNYGRLRDLGLFPDKGVTTRTMIVEEQNGVLNLLATMPVGSPGQQNRMGKRKVRSFVIPHIPLDDAIYPSEFDGVRAFGTENQTETLAGVMNNHLQTAKNKFGITVEHLRMGALKGVILDADGSLLYNLYTEFGVQQNMVDFNLGNTGTDVRSKCMTVIRLIEDNLKGETMNGPVRALVSSSFFDALTSHANVVNVFEATAMSYSALGTDIRKGFSFGGITFEEYRATATDAAGNSRVFINDDEGHCFPTGTMNSFNTIYAPADFLETVNTVGMPLYAKQEMGKYERRVDLHIQSNPLPICYRPGILVKIVA